MGMDIFVLIFSVILSFWLRSSNPLITELNNSIWLIPAIIIIGIPLYIFTGNYIGLSRYLNSKSLYLLAARNLSVIILLAITGEILNLSTPPIKALILIWLILTCFSGTLRFCLRDLLLKIMPKKRINGLTNAVIYGAGNTGAELANSLLRESEYNVIAFLDDDINLIGRSIRGIPIKNPKDLPNFIDKADQVLLAIPSLNRRSRRKIVDSLKLQGTTVLQVPSIYDITSGNTQIDILKPILIEDLLGRDVINPEKEFIRKSIKGSIICVTGAGGSVGSELCRQIIQFKPKKLILIDKNELNLYNINEELNEYLSDDIQINFLLGCVKEFNFISNIIKKYSVEIIFHAAAYKHVPIVEDNPLAGLANNVLASKCICQAAKENNVKKVILVSTDKAVRPTNIMGASKRLAELIFQAYAQEIDRENTKSNRSNTFYSMVRFGNVLDSSGSVVPLFKKQIAKGGPITLTHKDIIRYFMTIPEAAELVLQSILFAEGGDVFLLDMGEPIRIQDLAKRMIDISGATLRDENNPDGDIEIIYTGLRPGEKLYEELLIDKNAEKTSHPLIFKAKESFIQPEILWPNIDKLEIAITKQDKEKALDILSQLVPEWKYNGKNKSI